jgi:hypothetical protein
MSTERLSLRQRLVRGLFRIVGPAQVGPPPFATASERERHERDARSAPLPEPTRDAPMPGYQVTSYTDAHGTVHRSLVPKEPPADER